MLHAMTKRLWITAIAIGFSGLALSSCVSEEGYYDGGPRYYRAYDAGPRYDPRRYDRPPQHWDRGDRRDPRNREDWRRRDDRSDGRRDNGRDVRHQPDRRPDRDDGGRPHRDPRVWMQDDG